MPPSALILEPAPKLSQLLDWLLHHHAAPAHVIVCTDRASFLEQLQASLSTPSDNPDPDAELRVQPLLTPTLLNISASQNIKLSFVTSIPALLAYLTALPHKLNPVSKAVKPGNSQDDDLLVMLSPLTLHQDTSYWSAQGLSRTIALAAETAWKLQRRLMIVECEGISMESDGDGNSTNAAPQDLDTAMTNANAGHGADGPVDGDENGVGQGVEANPWDQHTPILSPGVRIFGTGADRSWTQKTVKVRDVARKWCLFGTLPRT